MSARIESTINSTITPAPSLSAIRTQTLTHVLQAIDATALRFLDLFACPERASASRGAFASEADLKAAIALLSLAPRLVYPKGQDLPDDFTSDDDDDDDDDDEH